MDGSARRADFRAVRRVRRGLHVRLRDRGASPDSVQLAVRRPAESEARESRTTVRGRERDVHADRRGRGVSQGGVQRGRERERGGIDE